MRGLAMAGLVSLAVSGVGCEAQETVDEPPLTARDELAQGLGTALCAELQGCCSERGFGSPGDGCRVAMRNAVMQAIILQEDEQRELVAAEVDTCVATFREVLKTHSDCRTLPTPNDLSTICPTVFSAMPDGLLAPGERCMFTHECQAPTVGERTCFAADGANPVCTWRTQVPAGAPCSSVPGHQPVCPEGLACAALVEETELTCRALASLGEQCEQTSSCSAGLGCFGDAGLRSCQPRLQANAFCTPSDVCIEDYFCETLTSSCQPFPDPCADGGCDTIVYENACR